MFVERFGWCLPVEGLAWPVVKRSSDCLDLLSTPPRQVGALGEVLTQEPVRVLVCSALPRTSLCRYRHNEVFGASYATYGMTLLRMQFLALPCSAVTIFYSSFAWLDKHVSWMTIR
jgi:hypothetical protein